MCLTKQALSQHTYQNHNPQKVQFDCHMCDWRGFSYLALERHKIMTHKDDKKEIEILDEEVEVNIVPLTDSSKKKW